MIYNKEIRDLYATWIYLHGCSQVLRSSEFTYMPSPTYLRKLRPKTKNAVLVLV